MRLTTALLLLSSTTLCIAICVYYTTYNSASHLALASIQQRPQMPPEQLSLPPAGSTAATSLVSLQVPYGGGCVGGASSLRVSFQILPPLSAAWLAPLHISFSLLPPLPFSFLPTLLSIFHHIPASLFHLSTLGTETPYEVFCKSSVQSHAYGSLQASYKVHCGTPCCSDGYRKSVYCIGFCNSALFPFPPRCLM